MLRWVLLVVAAVAGSVAAAGPCTPDASGHVSISSSGYQRSSTMVQIHNMTSGIYDSLFDAMVMQWSDETESFQQALTRRYWTSAGGSYGLDGYSTYKNGVYTQLYSITWGVKSGKVACKSSPHAYSNVSDLGYCRVVVPSQPYSLYNDTVYLNCELQGVVFNVYVRELGSMCILISSDFSEVYGNLLYSNYQSFGAAQQPIATFGDSFPQYISDDLGLNSMVQNVHCDAFAMDPSDSKLDHSWPRIVRPMNVEYWLDVMGSGME